MYDGEIQKGGKPFLYDVQYDSERQSLPSCVVLNTTEMQTRVEVCEEMMRGMPRCSKQEWRHKRE